MPQTRPRKPPAVNKAKTKPKKKKKASRRILGMSTTTTVIVTIVIPLLLSGFLNYYAHKPWILYFPLFGILLGLGYAGHLRIRALYPDNQPQPEASEAPRKITETTMEQPIQNTTISSTNQSGGFTGINSGIVNLGPKEWLFTEEQCVKFTSVLREFNDGGGRAAITIGMGDQDGARFSEQLKKLLNESGVEVAFENQAMLIKQRPGITINVSEINPAPPVADALRKAFRAAGIEAFGEHDPSGRYLTGGIVVEIIIGPKP